MSRPPRALTTALTTAALVAGSVAVLRRAAMRWGAAPAETRATLPGDGLVPDADLTVTRAVTIQAPPQRVLPWLRQLGHGRGGFYTYDALENLMGLGIHSADAVHPEWQVGEGDDVHLAEGMPLRVAVLDEGTEVPGGGAVVLHGVDEPASGPMPFDFSWAFVVVPVPDGGSRLLVRERYGYHAPGVALMVEAVSWVSWLMTQRMLRGVRDRAEA